MTARARTTFVWLFACALTLAAWGLARGGGTGRAPEAAAVVVLAAVKVRCITQRLHERADGAALAAALHRRLDRRAGSGADRDRHLVNGSAAVMLQSCASS